MRHLTAPRTATLALATLLALAGCGEGTGDTTATGGTPAAGESSTPEPSTPPTEQPATPAEDGTPASPSSETTPAAVYLVGDTPAGPRLFREFRAVPADDPLQASVALLTAGDALDPDYRTLFPAGGSFASVTHDGAGGQVVAELSDEGWTSAPDGMTRKQARLAVQQLVHTAQAAVQERLPVVVTLGGQPTSLFGVDTAAGVGNDDPLDVLALVNVTTPEQDGAVSGSFRASGVASAFEATVPWEVRRGDEVVLEGFATAEGWMDKLYPWQTDEIDVSGLEPGTYTFVASTGDASDGEGFGPTTDSKEFEVR